MSDEAATTSATPVESATPAAAEPTETSAVVVEKAATPDPAKKKLPQLRKYKIGNEEVALSDEDIARDYSKWKGGDKALREAAEARKSIEGFWEALQKDPEAVLNDPRLPLDRKKLAEKWLVKQIEEELNPPDPRDAKLTEAEKRIKEYEDREKAEKEAKEAAEYEAAKEQRKLAISETLHKAMQSTQLSKHPESAAAVLREMAMYMRVAKERGEEVTPEQLVEHVHNTRFHQMYTLSHQFEGEELIEFLGEEIVNRIRRADLARIKAKREPQATHKDDDWQPASKTKNTDRMDSYSAAQHARKIILGK